MLVFWQLDIEIFYVFFLLFLGNFWNKTQFLLFANSKHFIGTITRTAKIFPLRLSPSFTPNVISKALLGLAMATTHFQQNALFPTFCIFSLISPFSHSAVDGIVEIFSQKAGKHFKTSCRFSFYLFTSLQTENISVFKYSSKMVMWLLSKTLHFCFIVYTVCCENNLPSQLLN